MDDIEVIHKLEKLLEVESEDISLPKSKNQSYLKNKIRYLIVDNKINRVSLNALSLKNNLEVVFGFLSKLNSLTELNIPSNELKYIPDSITRLDSLKDLDLSSNQLKEFPDAIAKLTSLTSLDLSGNNLEEIPEAIANLTSLTYLRLANNQLKKIPDVFDKLTSLFNINLSGNQLKEIPESIVSLTSLKYLLLSGNQLKEIPDCITKHRRISLISLDLSHNQIHHIPERIRNLISLTSLNLASNDFVVFPESITNLTSLTHLDLSGNKLAEIPNTIANLTSLTNIDLSGNYLEEIPEAITNLTSLANLNLAANQFKAVPESITKLNSLIALDLILNQISNSNLRLKQIIKLPKLKELYLSKNPLSIPKEILGGEFNNCLQDLRNYFQDGEEYGWADNNELKIILIGNGGTGKTCLVNRLKINMFEEEYKSTHGIQLSQYDALEPYKINIWDFAGQDIYHATHRIFMRTRALFLVLWDNKTEHQEYSTVNENGKKRDYKNYKLDYWLNYVKVLGKGSRALIIQSKEMKDGKINPSQELMNAYKDIWIDNLSIDSAIDDPDLNGFENLKTAIRKTIKATDLLGKEQLPNNWVINRDKFHKLLDKEIKTISYYDFTTMCKGKESVNPDTLLHWLVDSGVVFYREGLFNNQIIIDQQWAINAVYMLFDRDNFYYDFLQNKKGFFTKSDLGKIWKENKEEERELFLSYMQSCEICYKTDNGYIAPALLPEERPKILNSFWEGKESYFVNYEMLFFHYGTMQSFLVRLGNMQVDALAVEELWQYGISFRYKENTFALVEAKPDDRQIIVRVSGQDTKRLLDKIRNLIEEIQGKEGISESFSKDGNIFFDERDKKKYSEMKKFFEKDEKNTFENKMNLVIQELKGINETVKRIDETTKDTHTDLKSLIVTFSNNILEIKQSFSFRKEDDEERINRLNEIIDNHRLLLEKHKNQKLTAPKEKAQIAFPKFSSLQTDSQTFIAMGFYFLEILPDNGDFSPAALQFCRALELEMKVFFINFKNLQSNNLLNYPKQNNPTYTKLYLFLHDEGRLALGEMIYILEKIPDLKKYLLFIELEKFLDNSKGNNILNQFLKEVKIFLEGEKSPRNKSAHTSPLSKIEAGDCKKRVLDALGYWLT